MPNKIAKSKAMKEVHVALFLPNENVVYEKVTVITPEAEQSFVEEGFGHFTNAQKLESLNERKEDAIFRQKTAEFEHNLGITVCFLLSFGAQITSVVRLDDEAKAKIVIDATMPAKEVGTWLVTSTSDEVWPV
jgi:hypothetical protein